MTNFEESNKNSFKKKERKKLLGAMGNSVLGWPTN